MSCSFERGSKALARLMQQEIAKIKVLAFSEPNAFARLKSLCRSFMDRVPIARSMRSLWPCLAGALRQLLGILASESLTSRARAGCVAVGCSGAVVAAKTWLSGRDTCDSSLISAGLLCGSGSR